VFARIPPYGALSIFTGNAHPQLALDICDYLKVEMGRADVFKFSNDNIFVKINENVREHDVFVVQPFCTPVSDSILELCIMLDALKRASARRVTAVVPYYAYGRSDKKDQPRVPITARLLADWIQVAGADRVLTMDLHAGQIQGFFKVPVDELTAVQLLAQYFRSLLIADPVVVSADIGFAKKARNFAELVNSPLAIVEKRRPSNAGEVETLNVIGEVRDRSAIIVDDEVDRGGSLLGAVDVLLRAGVREIYASCVHAVLSDNAEARVRAAPIREFVVTDTIRIDPPKQIDTMRVLSVAPLLGEAITRIHTGESVGALFGAPV
jgi:ribose-phosphate pyrophosphokinase